MSTRGRHLRPRFRAPWNALCGSGVLRSSKPRCGSFTHRTTITRRVPETHPRDEPDTHPRGSVRPHGEEGTGTPRPLGRVDSTTGTPKLNLPALARDFPLFRVVPRPGMAARRTTIPGKQRADQGAIVRQVRSRQPHENPGKFGAVSSPSTHANAGRSSARDARSLTVRPSARCSNREQVTGHPPSPSRERGGGQ